MGCRRGDTPPAKRQTSLGFRLLGRSGSPPRLGFASGEEPKREIGNDNMEKTTVRAKKYGQIAGSLARLGDFGNPHQSRSWIKYQSWRAAGGPLPLDRLADAFCKTAHDPAIWLTTRAKSHQDAAYLSKNIESFCFSLNLWLSILQYLRYLMSQSAVRYLHYSKRSARTSTTEVA